LASSTAIRFHKPHILVVEGKDDFWLCVQLLEYLKIETVQVIDTNGFDNLGNSLKIYTKTPGWSDVERVAVLVDADGDPAARSESVRHSIRAAGLTDPQEPGSFFGAQPATAYSLVPEAGGCLESLIRAALSDGSPMSTCVDQFLACCGLPDDSTSRRQKAWVHAYIAAVNPGLKIGEAAKAGVLRLDRESYEPLRRLLRSLQAGFDVEAG
jgi:hypothetical protein